MDKLEESIHKPSAPFHASFKKSDSDGFTYECEADISPDGITGQQIDSNPATKVGDDTGLTTSNEAAGVAVMFCTFSDAVPELNTVRVSSTAPPFPQGEEWRFSVDREG